MKKFYLHRLGCPKNDVDAEYIAGLFCQEGLSSCANPEDADLIIVNTCGFIDDAKEESIGAILSLLELKKSNPELKLIVTGCLSQRYAEQLAEEIPEIDGIFGIDGLKSLNEYIRSPRHIIQVEQPSVKYCEPDTPRQLSDSEVFAYLKISDGCDNRCSYCAIPDIRGSFRSRNMAVIVDEARFLLDSGKKEIILVSQESTRYGEDLFGQPRLIELLDKISALPGDFWLRVMYLHPLRLTEELIEYIIDNPRLCSYFDLPLQHVSDRLLGLMNRRVSRDHIETLLEIIRDHNKPAAVRTTFIVGFPGETDKEFEELCHFVDRWRFNRMGAFVYSEEEDTPAVNLPGKVDGETAGRRYEELMLIQQDIAFENNQALVGKELEIIVDASNSYKLAGQGRTRFDAPEIDQTVLLKGQNFSAGMITKVAITGWDGYDLIAEGSRS